MSENEKRPRRNLWAPWRLKYIQGINNRTECFICHNLENPEQDKENLVLWRTEQSIVLFNKFPYNNGHLLVAPVRHVGELEQLEDNELLEMMKLVTDAKLALTEAISPQGFNVGINLGHCAGAGLPGHLHIHIVPRWEGDTNFMPVIGGVDVISQSFEDLREQLLEVSKEKNLPRV